MHLTWEAGRIERRGRVDKLQWQRSTGQVSEDLTSFGLPGRSREMLKSKYYLVAFPTSEITHTNVLTPVCSQLCAHCFTSPSAKLPTSPLTLCQETCEIRAEQRHWSCKPLQLRWDSVSQPQKKSLFEQSNSHYSLNKPVTFSKELQSILRQFKEIEWKHWPIMTNPPHLLTLNCKLLLCIWRAMLVLVLTTSSHSDVPYLAQALPAETTCHPFQKSF